MLTLRRNYHETVVFRDAAGRKLGELKVLETRPNQVNLGFAFEDGIQINRAEVDARMFPVDTPQPIPPVTIAETPASRRPPPLVCRCRDEDVTFDPGQTGRCGTCGLRTREPHVELADTIRLA